MTPNEAARSKQTSYLLLTFMALFFGATWVAGKVAVEAIPPITLAALRFAIASLLLWLWARAREVPARRPALRDLPLMLGMGSTAVAGYNMFFLYGLKLAPTSDGAIIVPGFAPILTAILAWPLLRERVGRWGGAGFLIALAGLFLVIGPGHAQTAGRLSGDVLFLLGAVCWAIYSIIDKTATAPIQSRECHAVRNGDRNRAAFAPARSPSAGGPLSGHRRWRHGVACSTWPSSGPC